MMITMLMIMMMKSVMMMMPNATVHVSRVWLQLLDLAGWQFGIPSSHLWPFRDAPLIASDEIVFDRTEGNNTFQVRQT